jgi:HEAT repeat protein
LDVQFAQATHHTERDEYCGLEYRRKANMSDDVKKLAGLLGGGDPIQSLAAAEELSFLGPEAQPAAVELVRAMSNPSEEIREYVAAALEELGPPAVEQLQELAHLLADPNADVGYWAATLLGRLGDMGKPAVPLLLDRAEKTSSQLIVRERAVWALGQIGPPAAEAFSALKNLAQAADSPRLARLATAAIEQIAR